MQRKHLIVIFLLLILLALIAVRKENDSSLRFMKQQDQLAKPHRESTAQ